VVKITERIRAIEVAEVENLRNEVYVLECEGGLILIDTGFTPVCLKNIRRELEDMGKTWKDIKLVLITHAHGDHIENLTEIIRQGDEIEVMLGEGDVEILKEQTGVVADMGLEDSDLIDACGGIEVIHIPGHSDGNLSFYIRSEKTMIVGDTIFENKDGDLCPPPAKYSKDVVMATREIKRLLNYDFDKVLLSHGKSVLFDAKKKIEKVVLEFA
jgi:glyoxylase-like metal-dependent hydrolase (beta-lactamase superfamily II)